MDEIIKQVRQQLKANANPETAESSQRFFKEKTNSYGIKVQVVHNISKKYVPALKALGKERAFALAEILWQSGKLEESIVASNWAYAFRRNFVPEDFVPFKSWIDRYVNNWSSCDSFCNRCMGDLLQMYPGLTENLLPFTKDKNRWARRAAAVSLIVPARKGLFLDTIFSIADRLLTDTDDLVQKGYGWMLKEASKPHQTKVFDYVLKNKALMPRTALRYAIEKMPSEMRTLAMAR